MSIERVRNALSLVQSVWVLIAVGFFALKIVFPPLLGGIGWLFFALILLLITGAVIVVMSAISLIIKVIDMFVKSH